jgi:hypothetical protein
MNDLDVNVLKCVGIWVVVGIYGFYGWPLFAPDDPPKAMKRATRVAAIVWICVGIFGATLIFVACSPGTFRAALTPIRFGILIAIPLQALDTAGKVYFSIVERRRLEIAGETKKM